MANRFARLLGAAGIAVTLSSGAVIPLAAVSAASCGGTTAACDHTSPQTTGCAADAVTERTVYAANTQWPYNNLAKIELRYSPSCHTAWSRVSIVAGSGFGVFSTDEWVRRQSDGTEDHRHDSISSGESAYSHQLWVKGKSARACAYVSNGTVAAGQACTSYVAFP